MEDETQNTQAAHGDSVETDLNEEAIRIIKALKTGKDAASSWKIDVDDLLGTYLALLDATAAKQRELDANEGYQNVLAGNAGGGSSGVVRVNFSTASTIMSEATRVFSRQVDFLANEVDSTMMSLSSGTLATTTKKTKARESRMKAHVQKGHSALSDWIMPELACESTEALYVPWHRWCRKSTPDEISKSLRSQLIPEEAFLFDHVLNALAPAGPSETMEQYQARVLDSDSWVQFPSVPRCTKPRLLADRKKQCIYRPLVSMMPRGDEANAGAVKKDFGPAAVWDLIRNCKLAASGVDASGILFIPFTENLLQPHRVSAAAAVGGMIAPQCTPDVRGGFHALMPPGSVLAPTFSATAGVVYPDTPALPTAMAGGDATGQRASIGPFGDGQETFPVSHTSQPAGLHGAGVQPTNATAVTLMTETNTATGTIAPRRPPPSRLKHLALDADERCGIDAPLRVGKTWNAPLHSDLYLCSLDKLRPGAAASFLIGGLSAVRAFFAAPVPQKQLIYADVQKWKSDCRLGGKRGMKQSDLTPESDESVIVGGISRFLPAYMPLFEDIRRPTNHPLDAFGFTSPEFAELGDMLVASRRAGAGGSAKGSSTKTAGGTPVLETSTQEETVVDDDEFQLFREDSGAGDSEPPIIDPDPGFSFCSPLPGGTSGPEDEGWMVDQAQLTAAMQRESQVAYKENACDPSMDQTNILKEMHERVWTWRKRVEQWVAHTLSLAPFIVTDYVGRFAKRVSQAKVATDDAENRMADNKSPVETVSFRKLIGENLDRHEVARMFLTTLILTNQKGYKIQTVSNENGSFADLLISGTRFDPEDIQADALDAARGNRDIGSDTEERSGDSDDDSAEIESDCRPKPRARGRRGGLVGKAAANLAILKKLGPATSTINFEKKRSSTVSFASTHSNEATEDGCLGVESSNEEGPQIRSVKRQHVSGVNGDENVVSPFTATRSGHHVVQVTTTARSAEEGEACKENVSFSIE